VSKEPDSILKLCDFGLSKKVSDLSFEQKRGGTPLFLPPELIYRKNYDEKIKLVEKHL
jgi:serine/threonine protein kinase